MNTYRAGIDIGSTTVNLVLLNADGSILFGDYRRHHAHTQETLNSLLKMLKQALGDCALKVKITGSSSINLGNALGIPFVQKFVAVATALQTTAPQHRLHPALCVPAQPCGGQGRYQDTEEGIPTGKHRRRGL